MYPDSEILNPWEYILTFLSIATPHSKLKNLSIHLNWDIRPSKDVDDLANACGFFLRDAEALEPIINTLKDLLALNLELSLYWPSDFYEKSDHIRTQLSQSAVEEAVRKKLSKISEKVSITVSVRHLFM